MARWVAVLALLSLAQAQSFFGLSAVDRSVFSLGGALFGQVWGRVGVDQHWEYSAHLYLRRRGTPDLLAPGPGYYLGFGVEGGPVRLSGLLGLEAFLGESFALFLEGMAPLHGPGGGHFGLGLRYYPSGREVFTPSLDPQGRFRLYVPFPAGLPLTPALAYEEGGYALWLGGWLLRASAPSCPPWGPTPTWGMPSSAWGWATLRGTPGWPSLTWATAFPWERWRPSFACKPLPAFGAEDPRGGVGTSWASSWPSPSD